MRNTEQHVDYIYYTLFCRWTAPAAPRSTHGNVRSHAEPKPFSWVKPVHGGFSPSNFSVQDHILSTAGDALTLDPIREVQSRNCLETGDMNMDLERVKWELFFSPLFFARSQNSESRMTISIRIWGPTFSPLRSMYLYLIFAGSLIRQMQKKAWMVPFSFKKFLAIVRSMF
jgi:hypothetical protein